MDNKGLENVLPQTEDEVAKMALNSAAFIRATRELAKENEMMRAQLTESERQRAAAVEFIRHIDSEYGRYITDAGFERWRGPQEAGEGGG